MPADERASAQHRFMEGDAEIVVATNAFGMGVDKADVRTVVHWAIPKSVEGYYQEVGRGGRDGRPARAILLASRGDLGRLINFIKGDAVETQDVLGYVQRLKASCDGETTVIDAPRADRDRVCLGVGERAGLCTLEPARGGRLQVTFAASFGARDVALICRVALDRAWRAYHAIESFSSASAQCRRRALLDHFGDNRQAAAVGRCCDVCDPDTIGLPDPASLTPARAKRVCAAGRRAGRSRRRRATGDAARVACARQQRQTRVHRGSQQHARIDRHAATSLAGRACDDQGRRPGFRRAPRRTRARARGRTSAR